MSTITVHGASDDLIEIGGDIYEEFGASRDWDDDHDGGYVAVSDGTLLKVVYDGDGYWRINRLIEGSARYSKVEASDPDENYSDIVTLSGEIAWVALGINYARAKEKASA